MSHKHKLHVPFMRQRYYKEKQRYIQIASVNRPGLYKQDVLMILGTNVTYT